MKLDLLTNATIVDDAIRFVEGKSGRFHTTNTSIQVENIEKHVKEIQGNDKHMPTINQIF
jgi:hypothetical protein